MNTISKLLSVLFITIIFIFVSAMSSDSRSKVYAGCNSDCGLNECCPGDICSYGSCRADCTCPAAPTEPPIPKPTTPPNPTSPPPAPTNPPNCGTCNTGGRAGCCDINEGNFPGTCSNTGASCSECRPVGEGICTAGNIGGSGEAPTPTPTPPGCCKTGSPGGYAWIFSYCSPANSQSCASGQCSSNQSNCENNGGCNWNGSSCSGTPWGGVICETNFGNDKAACETTYTSYLGYPVEKGTASCYWTNSNCTGGSPAPTSFPTPTGARVRGYVYEEKQSNAKKVAGELYIGGVRVNLYRADNGNRVDFDDSNSGTSPPDPNYRTEIVRNRGYYMILSSIPVGNEIIPCSAVVPPNNVDYSRFFYCTNSNGFLRLKQWVNATSFQTVASSQGDFTLDGANLDIDFPMVKSSPTSTPTRIPTPTIPVPTATPGGSWRQVVGGDSYESATNQVLPPSGLYYYIDRLGSNDKSAGIAYYGSSLTVSPNNRISRNNNVKAQLSGGSYVLSYDVLVSQMGKFSKNEPSGTNVDINPTDSNIVHHYKSGSTYTVETGSNNPSQSVSINIIEGSLNINGSITPTSGKTVVYIVRDNLTIGQGVNTLDGVFIAGGTVTINGPASNATLSITGMVYADVIVESRSVPNPSSNPAVRYTYMPGYLLPLTQYLGKSGVNWQEVAP